MNIKHIFAAIELDSLDPERFSKHLVDAWRKIRFSSPPAGYSGSDEIGAALIGSDNFAWKSSGWFDRTGITFPAKLLPQNAEELHAHLQWMIDCRRDNDTMAYLWKSVQKMLPTNPARNCFVEPMSIRDLADALCRLAADETLLVKALLTGRLWRASALVAKKHESLKSSGHLNTIVSIVIVWALFDLQVIAYRLFHAEWNALDAGMESAENMTLESLHKILRRIADMAGRAEKAFANGHGLSEVDSELREFILKNDLINVARKNAARLNISRTSKNNRSGDKQAVAFYLQYLLGKLANLERIFNRRSSRPRLTVTGYASHAAGKGKARFGPGPLRDPKAKALESKHSVASARFSLPALTALLYAVEGVVRELGSIPSGGDVKRNADGLFFGGRPLLKDQQRKKLVTRMFAIYRDLFVRSQFNGYNTVSDRAGKDWAEKAEDAVKAGLPNPGLEPATEGWRSRPFKPLFPGVPARTLLATGLQEGRDELTQDPDHWTPKRVAAERKIDTRNVRNLATNGYARRHFRERAAKIEKGFGKSLGDRLGPPKKDPKAP